MSGLTLLAICEIMQPTTNSEGNTDMNYQIQGQLLTTIGGGFSGSRGVPTFSLNSTIHGISDPTQAASMARAMILAIAGEDATDFVCSAMEVA